MPPHNSDAERSVLGSLLRNNEVIDEVALLLQANSFYLDGHQKIYRAIVELRNQGGRPIDLVLLHEELSRRGQLEDIGRGAYLATLWEASSTAANVRYYAEIVREKSLCRRLVLAGLEIAQAAQCQAQPVDDLLEKAEQNILGISQLGIEGATSSLAEAIGRTVAQIDAFASGRRTRGIPTGFTDLDELTTGLHRGELIILGARPSVGKTAAGLTIANHVRKSGETVFFASLEQSLAELCMRLMCMEARVNSHRMRSGKLSEEDSFRLVDAIPGLKEGLLHIDDAARQSMQRIAANARRLHRQHGLGLIVVDYVQLIEPESRRDPRHEQVGQCSRRLKELAKELDVPVLALAQVGRAAEERPNQRPRLSDLRESGSLEADADTVMLLHRNEEQAPGVIEVNVAKQRNGPTGEITLAFRKDCMRFEDYIAGTPFGE